jgi:hypothetical protein
MKPKYRVEVPNRKRLSETFKTRGGAEAYAAMLFFKDRLPTKIIEVDKAKPEPLPEAPF